MILPAKQLNKDGEWRQFRLNSAQYIRRCLSIVVPDLLAQKRLFMHDGARSHASQETSKYLERKGVEFVRDWPPYSPDLNSIEYVWKDMKSAVGRECPLDLEELTKSALEKWETMPQKLLNAHCHHFASQLGLVQEKGKRTQV